MNKRFGKTKKDKASGAHARRLDNQQARANWSNRSNNDRSNANFPTMTCNGKKNRHRYTGKGNQTVIIG
jgi:hypothetical protein